MPYVVTTFWYPLDKTDEVVKVGLEVLKQFPEDKSLGTRVVPLAVDTSDRGMECMIITEVVEGKLDAHVLRVGKAMMMYKNIEGFRFEVKVWNTASEGFSLINMKSPM